MKNYNTQLAEAIGDFFRSDDLKFRFDEEKGVFRYGVNMQQVIRSVDFTTIVGTDYFTTRAVLPVGVPVEDKEMMLRMSEFLHRANYGIKNGNFEFDFRDGEIAYKTFVNCDDGHCDVVMPTIAQVRDSFGMASITIEHYMSGILDILFKGVSAKEAVEQCEGKRRRRTSSSEEETAERMADIRARLKALLEGRLNTDETETIEAEVTEEAHTDSDDEDIIAGLDPDALFLDAESDTDDDDITEDFDEDFDDVFEDMDDNDD